MKDLQRGLTERLADLRESFDRGFALPPPERVESRDAFLIVHAGGERYAVAMNAILGVEHHRRIVALALRVPGLLGLAALRGQLTPVFSLASLLGEGAAAGASTWLVLCKGDTPIALAFDQFETSVRTKSQDVCAARSTQGASHLARQAVRLDSGSVYVIDVPSAVAAAKRRLGQD